VQCLQSQRLNIFSGILKTKCGPAIERALASGEKEKPVTNQRGNSVLCIGNDPVRLNLRCALLKEHGWSVHSAAGGHEGIILFNQEPVDAVVLDFSDDGSESALIASELKRVRPAVPVIMLVVEGRLLVPGATKQVDAVIVKSEETLRLREALRTVLRAP